VKKRILALDLGARRIGVAVSDPLGITAQGLETIQRSNSHTDMEALQRLVRQYEVAMILVGQPLNMSGTAGTQAQKAEAFAGQLQRRLSTKVVLWDERLTTAEAQRVLKSSGVSLEKRKQAVDRLSAVLLLQSYLDRVPEIVSEPILSEPILIEPGEVESK
jgi:putative Holliday junction resolvase